MAGSLSDTVDSLQTSVDEYLQSTPNLPNQTQTQTTTPTPPPTTPLQDTQVDEEPKTSAARPSRIPFEIDREGSARITPYDVKTARDIFREELTTFNDEFEPRINIDDNIIKTAISIAKDEFFNKETGDVASKDFESAYNRASTNLNNKLDKAGANRDLRDATYELVGKIADDYGNRLRTYDAPFNVQERVAGRNPLLEEVTPTEAQPIQEAQAPIDTTNIGEALDEQTADVDLQQQQNSPQPVEQ